MSADAAMWCQSLAGQLSQLSEVLPEGSGEGMAVQQVLCRLGCFV
jgi:hypothetical protein